MKNRSLGTITLLAPTEKAFANLTEEEWKTLEDKSVADELLRRHIVTGKLAVFLIYVCYYFYASFIKPCIIHFISVDVIADVVCCDGVGMSTWPFSEEVNTANGFSMNVRRKNREQVIFGETTTESCDHVTKDGLIHYVDRVRTYTRLFV